MCVRWIQWKKCGGPNPGHTPDQIKFMCVLVAGGREEVENQNRFLEENQIRMNFSEYPAGEKTSTVGLNEAEGWGELGAYVVCKPMSFINQRFISPSKQIISFFPYSWLSGLLFIIFCLPPCHTQISKLSQNLEFDPQVSLFPKMVFVLLEAICLGC